MIWKIPWTEPMRELLAEQLRRFGDSLEQLARNLRDRIASSVGEALTTLVRALLGPGETTRSRPYEPPRRSWERSLWRDEPPSDEDWEDGDQDSWPPATKATTAMERPTPSRPSWHAWLAPLVQLWCRLCSPRLRPLVLGAVATGVAANLGPAWAVALIALTSSTLGLIAMADRVAGEANNLARLVAP